MQNDFWNKSKSIDTSTESMRVEGVLDRIVYSNDENGWSVVKIVSDQENEPITAIGNFMGLQVGENVKLSGSWVMNPKYGKQFKVTTYELITPTSKLGIEKYLGSGLIQGIGPVMAKRIVEQFGTESIEVIDSNPYRLLEVEGIGESRLTFITGAWVEQKKVRSIMLFLHEHGISTTYAIKIFKEYGDETIAILRKNPYRLATDIFGIGFKIADDIAQKLGIARDSHLRVEAAVLHFLQELSFDGHVCVIKEKFVELLEKNLEIDRGYVENALKQLQLAERILIENDGMNELVFLYRLYSAELDAAKKVRELQDAWAKPINIRLDKAISWIEQTMEIQLAQMQKQAIIQAIENKLVIITGGPGTGKTTIINGIIRIIKEVKQQVLLCAPTGRAAKRMFESTGEEAQTIHRLLEYSPHTNCFERNENKPLKTDVLIVDEVSMLDIVLFMNLLKALPESCRLIIVGDIDQLPSVGPGNVLRDLISSNSIPTIPLEQVFRQEENSQIITNAHKINNGIFPDDLGKEFFFMEQENPTEIIDMLKHIIVESIPRKFSVDPIKDIQVLTPMNKGMLGVNNLNFELQTLLNPFGKSIVLGSKTFRENDKVMQIRNNYELDVFNGDIGKIIEIDTDLKKLVVDFENKKVSYDSTQLDELVLAYACTIHKSQGSEYPVVVLPFHTQHYMMLQRNLLYTGITRGKKLVILIGSKKAVSIALHNNTIKKRNTYLIERIRNF